MNGEFDATEVTARLSSLATLLKAIRDEPAPIPEDAHCDPGLYPALEALKATLDFLDYYPTFGGGGIGRGAGLTRPLYDLLLALVDLERGHTHPLLRTGKTGKRGAAVHYQAVTAWAAIYMDTLTIAGRTNQAAASAVAKELVDIDISQGASRRNVRAATVKGWRDELNAGNGPDLAQAAWSRYVSQRAGGRSNPDRLADWAGNMLRGLVSGSRFRISP
jgi:hypothetical protein